MFRAPIIVLLSLALSAFVVAPCPAQPQTFQRVETEAVTALYEGDVASESGKLRVNDGKALIIANRDATILVDEMKINVAKGSIIIVEAEKQAVVVRALSDRRKGAVSVAEGDWRLKVSIGQEIAVFNDETALHQMLHDGLGRRMVHAYSVEHVGKVQVADVSLQDNLVDEPLLVTLRCKACTVTQQHAVAELLKTAAIYNIIQAATGQYQRALYQ